MTLSDEVVITLCTLGATLLLHQCVLAVTRKKLKKEEPIDVACGHPIHFIDTKSRNECIVNCNLVRGHYPETHHLHWALGIVEQKGKTDG